VSAPASATAAAGSPTTITATVSDADAADVLTITASGAPASLAFSSSPSSSPATASLSGTPAFGEAAGSPYSIHWAADDGAGGAASATTSLTITRTDTPPSVAAPDTALFSETFAADFAVSVNDAEGDDIASLTSSALPAGATFTLSAFNAAGHFEWTPVSGQAGFYPVTFTATSGSPALSASATTIVKVGPPDHRPIVTLTPTTYTINEGQHIHLTPTASDPEGDPFISFTCKGTQNAPLPPGVMFVPSPDFRSGTFDWTPDFTQSAVYHFDLEATSVGSLGEQISAGLNGGGITVVLVINVRNVDRAPVVSAPATANGTEGVALNVPVSASDPDGDVISSFTASPLPAGAVFTAGAGNTSGNLVWTPSFSQEGSYSVTFTASNLLTGSATTMITIAHANAPPALSAPTSQSVDEGSPLSFSVSAADGDGDHVTLSAPSRPVGAGFIDHGDNTGTFDWTPGFSQAGTYTVTFAGNDGHGGVATATTAITVSNVNRAPLANPGGPYSGLTSVPVSFDGSGSSDPDGDALTYMWSFGDGGTGTGAMPNHAYSAAGAYAVDLTVTDTGSPALSNTASTTANIALFLTARAFTVTGGNSTIKLGSGKPTWCAQVEPVSGNFALSEVNLGSLVLHYNGSQIPVSASKSTVDVDRDGNGVAEISACFAKTDLRALFASLPAGHSNVTVMITAGLVTGGSISASLTVDVQKNGSGSAMEVAVSPNPLNPIATLTFSMARPGSAQVGLYNLSGRLVRTLLPQSFLGAGYHDLTIDGRGDHGEKLPSGVYFYDVRTAEGSAQGRVTILK
jgi:PKD repeat protein